jgi:putative transport protein
MPKDSTLKIFKELGLLLFLTGAGISGGDGFFEMFDVQYFFYGVFMTIVPMIIGFLFAKYVLKLSLLNNLGSLTGGMTSTPALGTLINTAGTDDVASAYAATYPIALIAVVLVSQFLIILF